MNSAPISIPRTPGGTAFLPIEEDDGIFRLVGRPGSHGPDSPVERKRKESLKEEALQEAIKVAQRVTRKEDRKTAWTSVIVNSPDRKPKSGKVKKVKNCITTHNWVDGDYTTYVCKIKKVRFCNLSGSYYLIFDDPIPLIHPRPHRSFHGPVKGVIHFDIGILTGASCTVDLDIVRTMWHSRRTSQKIINNWTLDFTRVDDSITQVELRR